MITGAPAPSPTFLGGDRFLACGRLAFGPFTLGRVPAVGARTRALPILWSPRLRPVHAGPSARGGRPDPRTSHLVVASPSALSRWAECPRWAPGPAHFPSCGRLAFGCGSYYITGPIIQGANSSSPTPESSLFVCLPEATATISSKICRPDR